jgi:hypothetical protein
MRRLSVLLGTVVLAFTALPVAGVIPPSDLTVVYEINADHSPIAFGEMKKELTSIMGATGMTIRFKALTDVKPADRFVEIVIVRFRGRCLMEPRQARTNWSGTLAFTHSSDGDVLPFVDVGCDRVREVIYDAYWRHGDEADRRLGRALARVVAHELYHVLANTTRHSSDGIARPRLSKDDLVAEKLVFDADDLEKMRVPRSHHDTDDGS